MSSVVPMNHYEGQGVHSAPRHFVYYGLEVYINVVVVTMCILVTLTYPGSEEDLHLRWNSKLLHQFSTTKTTVNI